MDPLAFELHELPVDLRAAAERALRLVHEINAACISRGALMDAKVAERLSPLIVQSNLLLNALTEACVSPHVVDAEWLGAIVDGERRKFEAWMRAYEMC